MGQALATRARSTRLVAPRLSLLFGLFALASCQLLGSDDSIDAAMPKGSDENQTAQNSETNLADPEPREAVSFSALRASDPQAKLGAAQHPKILARFGGAYEDENLESLLAVIVGKLVAASDEPNRAYDITVLNSPTVNAFALPGGYLYVTRGLLALANDASEVAAVIAHEMAHVSSNHGIQRSERAKAADIAGRVATSVISSPVVGGVSRATTEKRLASFSQGQELQADAVGIKMMGEAGFDPYAAARFLESMARFAAWRSALNADRDDMNSSHPSTPRRVELARRHARAFGPPGTGDRNRPRFLTGINGLFFGDPVSEGTIRGQRFSHAKSGFTFAVPTGFELSNKTKSVLATGPNESALRFDAVNKEGQPSNPADYLKSGWVNGLDDASVKSVKINNLDAAYGSAQTGDWQFSISVISFNRRYYRFILAAPKSSSAILEVGTKIAGSFRALSASEKANLKPLRLAVVPVKQGESIAQLASKMSGVSRKVDLFKAINGLGAGDRVQPGAKVKVITEG